MKATIDLYGPNYEGKNGEISISPCTCSKSNFILDISKECRTIEFEISRRELQELIDAIEAVME